MKATRQHTKTHNTQLVLKTIYDGGRISRAGISRHTKLTRPTVSSIVTDLIEDNLVIETGRGQSAGGKRPMLLQVDENAYHLLCLDLGSEFFRGAIVNLRGEIVTRLTLPTNAAQGQEAVERVYQLIDQLSTITDSPLRGIAVGTPGLINPKRGIVRHAINLGWTNLPLGDLLSQRYELPTHIINDSQAAALGEFAFGGTEIKQNLLLIKVGRGIGAGIILGRQPFYGDSHGAGEIGHVVVQPNGDLCNCGNAGCLETVVSIPAILRRYEPAHTWSDLLSAYELKDPKAVATVVETGLFLGRVAANLIAAFNIEHLLIAGRIAGFGDQFLAAIRNEARKNALPSMVDHTEIAYGTLGTDNVTLGAAAIILKHELGIV